MSTIEQLELEIVSNSSSAISGIDALTQSLTKLKGATVGKLGLTAVARELEAINKVDINSVNPKIVALSTAISTLSQLPEPNMSGVISSLKGLPKALEGLANIDLSSLGDKLQMLDKSSEVAKGIDALTQSLANVKGISGKLGLSAVAKEIDSFNGVDVNTTKSKVVILSAAISTLANLPKANISGYLTPLKNLPKALEGMTSINMSALNSKAQELVSALNPLSSLTKTNLSSYITSLKKLPTVFEELSKIDMGAFKTKIQEVADAVKPLADEMQKVADGFSAMPTKIQKLLKETNKLPDANKKGAGSFTDLYHKVKVAINAVKAVGNTIASFITESNDYVENLNLFNVSMGQYADEAKKYAETVQEVMGIDSSEWMRNQGIFMTLATGFGVASDRAYTMSQNLTQLGYDLSSFFNIGYEEAMQKLQSGLAGELEPLRRLGYDLSQAKLEATALELGLNKSVSAMTQAEKAQLRYYAIMTQVTQVQGDMARTLNAPANQLRVLKAQANIAAREIGNIFIPALNAVLPYAIAFTKVIGMMANKLATLVGFELFTADTSGIEAVSTVTEETASSLENATESAKKLKNYMMGFDELNVIDPNVGADDISSGTLNFDLPEYDFLEGLAESRVDAIVEKIVNMTPALSGVLTLIAGIGTTIGAWKIAPTLSGSLTTITTTVTNLFGKVKEFFTGFATKTNIVLLVITALVAGLVSVYQKNEEVRNSVNKVVNTIKESLAPMISFISEKVLPDLKSAWDTILTPFTSFLEGVFTSIWTDILIPVLDYLGTTVIPNLVSGFMFLWNDVLAPLGQLIASGLMPYINALVLELNFLWNSIVIPLAKAIGGVLCTAWEELVKIIRDGALPILKGLIQFVTGVFTGDWKKAWEGVYNIFYGVWEGVTGIIDGIINILGTAFESVLNGIIPAINGVISIINGIAGTTVFNIIPKVSLGKVEDAWKSLSVPTYGISMYANGGFPTEGQMFIAREDGAEMVGSIGRRTAVANNDQIVAGITSGVATANEEQNALLREQNSLLRSILEKDSGVYLDGKNLANSVEKYQRERGRNLIVGGVL